MRKEFAVKIIEERRKADIHWFSNRNKQYKVVYLHGFKKNFNFFIPRYPNYKVSLIRYIKVR